MQHVCWSHSRVESTVRADESSSNVYRTYSQAVSWLLSFITEFFHVIVFCIFFTQRFCDLYGICACIQFLSFLSKRPFWILLRQPFPAKDYSSLFAMLTKKQRGIIND